MENQTDREKRIKGDEGFSNAIQFVVWLLFMALLVEPIAYSFLYYVLGIINDGLFFKIWGGTFAVMFIIILLCAPLCLVHEIEKK